MDMSKHYDSIRELYEQRWALNSGDSPEKETVAFWDEKAGDFAARAHSPEARAEAEAFLSRFAWSQDETVLDVAAGPGTFAIPLSHLVKSITVTDFSTGMLDQLLRHAVAEGVHNLDLIRGRWLEIDAPGIFDTVLCLNSLGVVSTDGNHRPRLAEALKKLRDACSRRLVVLIPHADSPLDETMRQILGLEEVCSERRRVAILYFAMVDCGMLPNLEIISRPSRWTFASREEACETLLHKAGVDSSFCCNSKFVDYLATRLIKDPDGRYNLVYNVSQALFTWNRQL